MLNKRNSGKTQNASVSQFKNVLQLFKSFIPNHSYIDENTAIPFAFCHSPFLQCNFINLWSSRNFITVSWIFLFPLCANTDSVLWLFSLLKNQVFQWKNVVKVSSELTLTCPSRLDQKIFWGIHIQTQKDSWQGGRNDSFQ